MLKEDSDKLKDIIKSYSAKEVMRELSEAVFDVADDCSDEGSSDKAKELTVLGTSLSDLISGRPFLV